MSRRLCSGSTAALLGAGLLVWVAAEPAVAHTHPTPVELDAPAVVQVRTDAVVNISLIEHHKAGDPPHIRLFRGTYRVPLSTNSGFAVDPTGAIVTTGAAVAADLPRATIYAVNRIFHERYGAQAPVPADPYSRATIGTDSSPELNARLQQCYDAPNTTEESGGCVIAASREVRVLPFVTDQRRYGNLVADVLFPTAGASDVAVLRVGASSMPTVRLADALAGTAYSVLGFKQPPAAAASQSNVSGHFSAAGQPGIKRDETYAAQLEALRRGVQGGPVVGEKGDVVGFLRVEDRPGTGADTFSLVGTDKIRQALKTARVTAHQGPTDAVYEAASHDYKNALYASALPRLRDTLKLYPGHALASEFAAVAAAKAGTKADLTNKDMQVGAPPASTRSPSRSAGVLPLVAAALTALVIAVLLWWRRRRATTAVAEVPSGPPDPVPAWTSASGQAHLSGPRGAASAAEVRAPAPREAPSRGGGSGPGGTDTHPGSLSAPRARAGVAGAGPDRSRVRAAAGATQAGAAPPGRVSEARDEQLRTSAHLPGRPCRVCGNAGGPDEEYCEDCGYPAG